MTKGDLGGKPGFPAGGSIESACGGGFYGLPLDANRLLFLEALFSVSGDTDFKEELSSCIAS